MNAVFQPPPSKYLIEQHLPFHLKEAFYSFSWAYPNCQHHYSRTLGPLLNKMRPLAHKHCSTETVELITEMVTK